MIYQGSCHCGQVAYEVEGDIQGALACNCSMCQRKGSLLWSYAEGVDPKGNPMAAINLRCIEGIDLDAIPVQHFDGRDA